MDIRRRTGVPELHLLVGICGWLAYHSATMRLLERTLFSRVCWSARNCPARGKSPVYGARGVFLASIGDALIILVSRRCC